MNVFVETFKWEVIATWNTFLLNVPALFHDKWKAVFYIQNLEVRIKLDIYVFFYLEMHVTL